MPRRRVLRSTPSTMTQRPSRSTFTRASYVCLDLSLLPVAGLTRKLTLPRPDCP